MFLLYQRHFFHLATVFLHTLSIPHAHAGLHYCAAGQEERSMPLPTPSLLSVLNKLSEHTLIFKPYTGFLVYCWEVLGCCCV